MSKTMYIFCCFHSLLYIYNNGLHCHRKITVTLLTHPGTTKSTTTSIQHGIHLFLTFSLAPHALGPVPIRLLHLTLSLYHAPRLSSVPHSLSILMLTFRHRHSAFTPSQKERESESRKTHEHLTSPPSLTHKPRLPP